MTTIPQVVVGAFCGPSESLTEKNYCDISKLYGSGLTGTYVLDITRERERQRQRDELTNVFFFKFNV